MTHPTNNAPFRTALAALSVLACNVSGRCAPVMDGERDASYTLVSSSPTGNLLVDAAHGINDPEDPVAKGLDAGNLWAANTRSDLYLYIELPQLDLNAVAGEWAVTFHLKGANDAIQRKSASDPYGASVDYGYYVSGSRPGLNVVLKSNFRGFAADFDGNQGYAFLIPVNTAATDWDWENGNFLSDGGWINDTAANTIHGRGTLGGEIVYKAGRGIELKIPFKLFGPNPAQSSVAAPKPGDTLQMQFYDNTRSRTAPTYARGPIDEVPFEVSSRTNPARGTLTQWASYTLATAGTLEVTGALLTDVADTGHVTLDFSDALGAGATTAANYSVVNEAAGVPLTVTSTRIDPTDPTRVILGVSAPAKTTLRITASNVRSASGATLSSSLNSAEVSIGSTVTFNLYDPYGAYSSLGNDPATGQPYRITVTGDPIGWRTSADGSNEIAMAPVPGEAGHYRSAPLAVPPGVFGYKYRVPTLPHASSAADWNALNPHDRRFFVPADASAIAVSDNAANNAAVGARNGGSVRVTFTLVDHDNVANGQPVYLTGDLVNWSDAPGTAIPMPAAAGAPNTYSATFDLPDHLGTDTTTQYEYILKPAVGTDWASLNPLGNRWANFHGTGSPAAQTVEDVLGGTPIINLARIAGGLDAAPMWSPYYSEQDVNLSGLVDVVDVMNARTAGRTLPRLTAQGTHIVDSAGNVVPLRGINLGGWFVEEMWMTPWVTDPPSGSSYPTVQDHVSLWSTLTQRLGTSAAADVRTAWRNAWIRQADFTRIKQAGFNVVRLPFLYDILDEPGGMDWLRNAVAWANAAGLYVILDLHGAPGSQNAWDHSGQINLNQFFYSSADIAKGVQVWTTLAQEFGSNPGVAGFDLLNEPAGAPDANTLYSVTNQLYQAVHAAAPNTIAIIEDGYKGVTTLPPTSQYGWTNVAYSIHIYDFAATSAQDHITSLNAQMPTIADVGASRNVPMYIGEFFVDPYGSPDLLKQFLTTMNAAGFSWSAWTYKTVATSDSEGMIPYYSNPAPVTPLNPFTDSAATLISKMNQVRTELLKIPTGVADAYHAGTPH